MKKRAQNHSEESGLINTVDFRLENFKRKVIREGKHAINLEELIPDVFSNTYLQRNGVSLYMLRVHMVLK